MITWFNRTPGSTSAVSTDDSHMVLVGTVGAGDWVRLPQPLGGQSLRVMEVALRQCPKCKQGPRRSLELEDHYVVIECVDCGGFVWARKPTEVSE